MIIHKGNNNQLTKNFKEKEFFCKNPKKYVDFDYHYLDDRIPELCQFIRDWAGCPVSITSSVRTREYQQYLINKGYSTAMYSPHLLDNNGIKPCAVDLLIHSKTRWLDLRNMIIGKNGVFKALRGKGVTGFGIYSGVRSGKLQFWFHFDFKPDRFTHTDEFGKFHIWEEVKRLITWKSYLPILLLLLAPIIYHKIG